MKLRLAILDMNAGLPNQGMRCIRDIVANYKDLLQADIFDIRVDKIVPGLEYDLYISSGGPGDPMEGDGVWDTQYYQLIQDIWDYNKYTTDSKKYIFFICHSFQMACHHFGLGKISKRKSASFGIQPVHKTKAGFTDLIFENLPDPFHVVESRDWQIIQPNLHIFKDKGAEILALEKIRTHVEYERAIMAVRFSEEMVGTQFHPEADPHGMLVHFSKEENRDKVINNYGVAKYDSMMAQLEEEDKILLTHRTILPNFIENAIKVLNSHAFSIV
ncbi:MAG: GMP synthase [Saprospiraceae bacterium]|nr:GMP synthase [Saprospiraceae bacterium]